ncbi:hypothetical protein RUM44_004849 [Polyplax serrata]|uniref:Uncharacterized protein n=1 Tax=Polyplax serrata TaxID=468196 RepID=A0ABR1B3Z6_POLSC
MSFTLPVTKSDEKCIEALCSVLNHRDSDIVIAHPAHHAFHLQSAAGTPPSWGDDQHGMYLLTKPHNF